MANIYAGLNYWRKPTYQPWLGVDGSLVLCYYGNYSTAWDRPSLCADFLSLYLLVVLTLFVLDTVSSFLLLHLSVTCRPSYVCLFLSGIPFHLMLCLVLILVLLCPVSTVSLLLIVSLLVCNCLFVLSSDVHRKAFRLALGLLGNPV